MAQAPSVAFPIKLPLATPLQTQLRTDSNLEILLKAHLFNCFAEYQPDTKEFSVEKRPGSLLFSAISAGPSAGIGKGISYLSSHLISIVGGNVYATDGGSAVSVIIGTVDTAGGFYRFHTLPNSQGLAFSNGVKAYFISSVAGPVTQIVTNFPTSFVKSFVYLNSRFYIGLFPNRIRGATNLDDITTWDLLNELSAQDEPDDLVGLFKHLTYVTAIKEWTTEFFFNDQQNIVGSTLSPQQQSKLDVGCFSVNTIQEIDGSLFWMSSNKQKKPQVLRIDGLQETIISTPHVEKILEALATGPSVIISADQAVFSIYMKISGHRFYILNLTTLGFSLVYDIDQQLWYVWGEDITATRTFGILGLSGVTTSSAGVSFAQDYYTGDIYKIAPDYKYPTDSGRLIEVDIYTKSMDLETPRSKQVNMMYFDAERVIGNEIEIRFNDQDYLPTAWSSFRTVNLDNDKSTLERCGSFNTRAHHIRHKLPIAFRINSVRLQVDIGTL